MTRGSNRAISVVVTTRDRTAFLDRALESVLAQSVAVREIFVVDDGSSIPVTGLPRPTRGNKLQLIRHEQPRGAPAARNTGLSQATCDYVAFLDDDDHWEPEKLEQQRALMEESKANIGGVFCYSTQWSPLDSAWKIESRTPGLTLEFKDFLHKTYFGTSIPLLRRTSLLEVGGFDESLASVQDRDLWLRLARIGPFVGVPRVLAHRAIHGPQITTDLERKIEGWVQFMRKYARDLAAHPRLHGEHCWKLGLMCCLSGDLEQAREWLRRATLADPSNPGPAADLQKLEEAPEQLARTLPGERFNRVGDLVLYY
jgi:GT2 family glycosyltransferase